MAKDQSTACRRLLDSRPYLAFQKQKSASVVEQQQQGLNEKVKKREKRSNAAGEASGNVLKLAVT